MHPKKKLTNQIMKLATLKKKINMPNFNLQIISINKKGKPLNWIKN